MFFDVAKWDIILFDNQISDVWKMMLDRFADLFVRLSALFL